MHTTDSNIKNTSKDKGSMAKTIDIAGGKAPGTPQVANKAVEPTVHQTPASAHSSKPVDKNADYQARTDSAPDAKSEIGLPKPTAKAGDKIVSQQ